MKKATVRKSKVGKAKKSAKKIAEKRKARGNGPQNGYTVRIVCAKKGCEEVRWIKPSDAHHTDMCVPHKKEAVRAHRAAYMRSYRKAA